MTSYLAKLTLLYEGQQDFRTRTVDCGNKVTVVNLDTMCDDNKISNYVIAPLLCLGNAVDLNTIKAKLSCGVEVEKLTSFDKVISKFVNGCTLVFVDEQPCCLAVDTRIETGRTVTEPPTAMVMHGPREGFVESEKVNVTLLRKRLKTTHFVVKEMQVGKYTDTTVAVCYIDDIADVTVVQQVEEKIRSIVTDGILDSSYLANYLDDNKTLLFKRVGSTEKPDVVVGKLLEGRIAVIADGSPMVLTVPYLYIEDLQSPGDYYDTSVMTTLSRALRFVSVVASVLLPALYVCLQSYDYQIIPLPFLITILNATEAIPFSPVTEMLLVLIIFDILREANLRMPTAVGISLSLVGAIVLGDAAVKAGLIGAPAVMIGALSGIGLFTMPDNTLVLSLLRLVITFLGGLMGLLGVILSMMVILVYLCSLSNFNVPFLAPFAPDIPADRQDGLTQHSVESMTQRPKSLNNKNKTRRK